jgi:hypothetical protein
MKSLYLIPFVFLLMSFTHPFAQDGSVDNDRELLDERIEKARENKTQEKRAKEAVKQEQESREELDRNLQPDAILQDKKEGSVE